MKVILIKKVKKLGNVGDIVDASDGYARNYLIPKGLATEATDGNLKELKKKKAAVKKKKDEEIQKAKELAERISTYNVTIPTKGGENGRLFGSITSKDIAEALEKQYNVKIDKKKINLSTPIKQIGEFTIEIKVYPEITAKLKVKITV